MMTHPTKKKRVKGEKMLMKTKRSGFSIKKKLLALIIAFMIVLGYSPATYIPSVNAAENELVILASDLNRAINDNSSPYAQYIDRSSGTIDVIISDYNGRDVRIEMDQALTVDKLWVNFSNTFITGDKALTLNNTSQIGRNFTLESGSNLILSGNNAKLNVQGNFYNKGSIDLKNAYRLYCTYDFYLQGGSISGNALKKIIECDNGSIYIEGGEINATSSEYGLYAKKDIKIDGGYLNISATSADAIYANYNFYFNGGQLDARSSSTSYDKCALVAGKSITISDNCFIKVPDYGTVGSCNGLPCIADKNGTKAGIITLKESINLSKATVTGIEDKEYTGSPITQSPVVTYNSTVLKENYHYTVSYQNNTAAGTATVVINSIHDNDVSGSITKTFKIIGHEHTVVIDKAVAATCQKTGLTEGSHCSECNIVIKKQEVIPKISHNFQDVAGSAKAATCTTNGKTADKKCTMCDATIAGTSIPAKGHKPVTIPAVEPTTTSTGLTEGKKCSECGYVLVSQQVIPMIDNTCQHVWNSGVVTIEPKCLELGEKLYTCTKCGGTMTEPIAALGHLEVIDAYKAPTTTSTGLTEGSHCGRCQKVIKEQITIPMLEPEPAPASGSSGTGNNDDKDKQEEASGKQNNNQDSNKSNTQNNSNNQSNNSANTNAGNNTKKPVTAPAPKYSNEWVNGKWYDELGNCTYEGILSWNSDATGWWVEDSSGWYPTDSWQKIDGYWYYFKPDGYMASGEYYKGYWFNSNGTMDDKYFLTWKSNSSGWWVEDISGWWPSSSWLKIDGYWYYFDGSGYMVTNQYVDGCWLGADGACW